MQHKLATIVGGDKTRLFAQLELVVAERSFVPKPCDLSLVVAAVDWAIEDERSVDENVVKLDEGRVANLRRLHNLGDDCRLGSSGLVLAFAHVDSAVGSVDDMQDEGAILKAVL